MHPTEFPQKNETMVGSCWKIIFSIHVSSKKNKDIESKIIRYPQTDGFRMIYIKRNGPEMACQNVRLMESWMLAIFDSNENIGGRQLSKKKGSLSG